ncbi:TPA: hypothetical protein QCS32_006361, partial [Bacillus thuringiensis]|nr:hypothetical protein [Bacillus thuringiensis]
YKVRIRYACNGNAELFVGKYYSGKFYEKGTYSLTSTYSGELTSDVFRYLDTFSMTANETQFKIELRKNSGENITI